MDAQPGRDKASSEAPLRLAKAAALGFLTRRNRSESEVRRRLGSHYPAPIVEQVIQWLAKQRLIDDAALAQEWRQQRERKRPKGEAMIRHELLGLGIDRQVVDQALEGFDPGENAYQAACTWRSKQSSKGALEYAKWRQRLWGHLQRRGFENELIGETVRRLWSELSDPLDGGVDTDAHEQQRPDIEPVG